LKDIICPGFMLVLKIYSLKSLRFLRIELIIPPPGIEIYSNLMASMTHLFLKPVVASSVIA